MRMLIMVCIASLLFLALPVAAGAGDFDGSKPILCSVTKAVECTPEGGCHEILPESVGVPQFLMVDLEKKTIKSIRESDGDRTSIIRRMERMEGRLILQGSDEGIRDIRDSVGWTAMVMEGTGDFVVTEH